MKPQKAQRVQECLAYLKQTLIDENLQIGVNSRDNSLFFFDTDVYLETGKYSGVVVDIHDLAN